MASDVGEVRQNRRMAQVQDGLNQTQAFALIFETTSTRNLLGYPASTEGCRVSKISIDAVDEPASALAHDQRVERDR